MYWPPLWFYALWYVFKLFFSLMFICFVHTECAVVLPNVTSHNVSTPRMWLLAVVFDVRSTLPLTFWTEIGTLITAASENVFVFSTAHRMTTCLENLEMSGNLNHVREMSGKKSSWKSVPKRFITRWIFAFRLVFSSMQLVLHVSIFY